MTDKPRALPLPIIYARVFAVDRNAEDWRPIARAWLGLDPDKDEAGAEAVWRETLARAREYWHGGAKPADGDNCAMTPGTRIDETGTLVRNADKWFFRRDVGGRYRLDIARVTLPQDGARGRLIGVVIGDALVDMLAFDADPGSGI